MSYPAMVVGLAFTEDRSSVLVIHKNSGPPCVRGNWNGIGGKIEPGEEPKAAMIRECKEEADILIESWRNFVILRARDYVLHFFVAYTNLVRDASTMEDEEVQLYHVPYLLNQQNVMANLRWMIPLLRDLDMDGVSLGELPIGR